MKAHIGVDADSGLVHTVVDTAANVNDATQAAGKASIRAKVEHPFRVIKRQFGHVKVRYRGLAKNTAQLHTLAVAHAVRAEQSVDGTHSVIVRGPWVSAPATGVVQTFPCHPAKSPPSGKTPAFVWVRVNSPTPPAHTRATQS